MKQYSGPEPGEWVQPIKRGYKLSCSECGMVNKMDFRIHEGRVQFRLHAARRETAARRRGSEFKKARYCKSCAGPCELPAL